MTTAAFRLAWFSPDASFLRAFDCAPAEVLLEGAVFEIGWHPGLDMLMQLTPIDTALLAFLFADYFPR
jgi:hypothetical protein